MSPLEQLREEHAAIRSMLCVLEHVCTKLETNEHVNPAHLEQILEFLRVFADRCHHGKEEEFLFPALESAGFSRQGGPTGVMLEEHEEGRTYVKIMSDAVSAYRAGISDSTPQIVRNARHYSTLLHHHIEKENTILFPMADVHLSDEKREELRAGFAKVEKEVIGPEKQKEMVDLLHHLEGIYGS